MILGELKEFKRSTLKELEYIRKEIHNLNAFKWRVTGIMSFLVGLAEIAHIVISK